VLWDENMSVGRPTAKRTLMLTKWCRATINNDEHADGRRFSGRMIQIVFERTHMVPRLVMCREREGFWDVWTAP
jgi:hypothetical protein